MNRRRRIPIATIVLALLLASGSASAQSAATLSFTPAVGDDSLQKFVNDLSGSEQERRQLLQAITTTRSAFEQHYAAKGWKNNVAGAYAFFIGSLANVWTGNEPSAAEQDRLFEAMAAELAPALARSSDQDKTSIYNTLIASASLPLLLYIDGTQNNNAAEIEKARELAGEYSRKILHSEPQELAAMLQPASNGNASTPTRPATEQVPSQLPGKWQSSISSTVADAANAGYTTRRYEFKPDGTYLYTQRQFYAYNRNIIIVKESGTYTVNGGTLTVAPSTSTVLAYEKAGGVDTTGTLVSSQARPLEKVAYRYTFHYFEGIREWNLVLMADAPTQRDGPFSSNSTYRNAWYFDHRYTDKDLTAAKN